MKYIFLIFTVIFFSSKSNSQCRDTIIEKFGTGLPVQGGTWVANSIIYGDSLKCPGLSCSFSAQYYLNFNGYGDYIQTPFIPNQSVFSFWYKRSSNSSPYHRAVVETSSDAITWTTQLTITTFTASYTKITLSVNNVYVRIRDIRTLTTDTKVWYVDDVSWSWENHVGVWTGNFSSDWSNPLNWCKSQVPTSLDDVKILPGTTYGPVISSTVIGECKNITITYPGSLTINGGKLRVNGVINTYQTIYTRNGTLELNGIATQTLRGSYLSQNLLGNLIISNPNGVSLGGIMDTLKIKNTLTFSTTNSTLTTNNNLTLLSSDSLTASIGDLTGNHVVGNITVERYIPNHSKAWQLLAIPTKGQTINASWQEGNVPLGNTKPGRGIILSGSFTGTDIFSTLPSIKTYNPITNFWDGISSTNNLINNYRGYMVFVRGDRSVTAYNQVATSTTLRTTGAIYSPDSPPPTLSVFADNYECINNFYASSIDFSKLTKTGGIQNTFWVWDPKLTNSSVSVYGYGGYQNFVWNGTNYVVVPGGGSYSNGNTNIESGISFLVKSFGSSGTLSFSETAKVTGSNTVTKTANSGSSIQINLSTISNNEDIVLDGVYVSYDRKYSNSIDRMDVMKLSNIQGISIYSNSQNFGAEFRNNSEKNDTICLNLYRLMEGTYKLTFITNNIDKVYNEIYIYDSFLETLSPITIDSVSNYLFTFKSKNSSDIPSRFSLILKK